MVPADRSQRHRPGSDLGECRVIDVLAITDRQAVQLLHRATPIPQDASEVNAPVGFVGQLNFQNELHHFTVRDALTVSLVSADRVGLLRDTEQRWHGIAVAMTILREWRGELRRELADEYVAYIRDTGLAEYRATPGNLGALIAVRDLDDERAEVITLSWWPSMDAIRGFAGDDVERAVYYPEDDRYLLTKPEKVQHYESHGLFDTPTPD